MGNLIAVRSFVRQDEIIGQGKAVLLMAKRLHLKNREVDRIFHEYAKYEDHKTNLTTVKRVLEKNRIKPTVFYNLIFQLFDRNKTGDLSFLEFMTIIWCLLTSDEEAMAQLCFNIFDVNRKNVLDLGEIKYLIHVIWNMEPKKSVLKTMEKLELNKDGIITLDEFILFTNFHPEILSPFRKMKIRLQKKIVFQAFWLDLITRRNEKFHRKSIFEICDRLDDDYLESSIIYLNSRRTIPEKFINQYNMIQNRKKQRRTADTELPYELRPEFKMPEIILPLKSKKSKSSSKKRQEILPV